jgi:hypothetical protein
MMNDMKAIYGVVLGLLLKACELIAAACNFVITHGEERLQFNKELLIYCGYGMCCLFIHYIPCCIGDEIYAITDGFSYDLFSSDWTDGDRRYKTSMLIFGENLIKPIKLSFFFYDKLTMETLKEVST